MSKCFIFKETLFDGYFDYTFLPSMQLLIIEKWDSYLPEKRTKIVETSTFRVAGIDNLDEALELYFESEFIPF